MKRTAAITLPFLCVVALLACGDECAYRIKYEITGTAPLGGVSVLFANEYGDDEAFSSIRLPWVKEFDIQFRDDRYYGGKFVSGVFPAYVTATLTEYGSVTAKLYYNGELADSAAASGRDGTATVRHAVKL
jgi:hypothetical protein